MSYYYYSNYQEKTQFIKQVHQSHSSIGSVAPLIAGICVSIFTCSMGRIIVVFYCVSMWRWSYIILDILKSNNSNGFKYVFMVQK